MRYSVYFLCLLLVSCTTGSPPLQGLHATNPNCVLNERVNGQLRFNRMTNFYTKECPGLYFKVRYASVEVAKMIDFGESPQINGWKYLNVKVKIDRVDETTILISEVFNTSYAEHPLF